MHVHFGRKECLELFKSEISREFHITNILLFQQKGGVSEELDMIMSRFLLFLFTVFLDCGTNSYILGPVTVL
jgi:hypothetical protein